MATRAALDFSGSPGIIVPQSATDRWHGMYLPAPTPEEADLVLKGAHWLLDDEMDFAHPRTAYDRICAIEDQHNALVELSEKTAVVLYGDAALWLYLPEHQCVLSNPEPESIRLLAMIASAGWTTFECLETCDWQVKEPLRFFNSTAHGGTLLSTPPEPSFPIELPPANYQVQYGHVGAAQVFRLVQS